MEGTTVGSVGDGGFDVAANPLIRGFVGTEDGAVTRVEDRWSQFLPMS